MGNKFCRKPNRRFFALAEILYDSFFLCFFPKERIVLAKHMQAFRFSKQLCHDQCHADEAVLPLTLEGFEANTKRALRSNPSPSGIQFHLKSARHGKIGNEIRKNCIYFFLLPGISFFW